MPVPTDGDVAVVKPYYAEEQAYDMGYDRFEGLDGEEAEDFHLEPFRSTATYANHTLPDLRALAGFADSGPGTFTVDRQVAAIHEGCEEDHPAEAELVNASDLLDEFVRAWERGAYDAVEGRDRDPDRA